MKMKNSCRNRRGCWITVLPEDEKIKPVILKKFIQTRVLKPKIKK